MTAAAGAACARLAIRRDASHSRAYVGNFGPGQANAGYLCFFDDDRRRIDDENLKGAARTIADASDPVDLYMASQVAVRGRKQEFGPVWLEGLSPTFHSTGIRLDSRGEYTVTVEDVVRSHGFRLSHIVTGASSASRKPHRPAPPSAPLGLFAP